MEKKNGMIRDPKARKMKPHLLMSKLNRPIYNLRLPLIFLVLGIFMN